MTTRPTIFKDLPLSALEADPNHPRRVEIGEYGRLDPASSNQVDVLENEAIFKSIQDCGILRPISVNEVEGGRYFIIDGHRRYRCAKKLGIESVLCRVYKGLTDKEFALLQFHLQIVHKDWSSRERAKAISRIKRLPKLKSMIEPWEYEALSKPAVFSEAAERSSYSDLMTEHRLKKSYKEKFGGLEPKLRQIKDIDVREVVVILFRKVNDHVIRNANDFRSLQKIFVTASKNEAHIHAFLTDDGMTVRELQRLIAESRIAIAIERFLIAVGEALKAADGRLSTNEDLTTCLQTRDWLLARFPESEFRLADYRLPNEPENTRG